MKKRRHTTSSMPPHVEADADAAMISAPPPFAYARLLLFSPLQCFIFLFTLIDAFICCRHARRRVLTPCRC